MKVVINDDFGGFGISDEAYEKLIKLGIPIERKWKGKGNDTYIPPKKPVIYDIELQPKGEFGYDEDYWEEKKKGKATGRPKMFNQRYSSACISRTDPRLVQVVEKLGTERASGLLGDLKVVKIPDNIKWTIEEYDGMEYIAEIHRTWD